MLYSGDCGVTNTIIYKEPHEILIWLDTALKTEWQKFAASPVRPDLDPDHMAAQGWGYVIAGYSLIEQGLKAVLHMRGVEPPKTHVLSDLYTRLPSVDQDVLRTYYDDFRNTFSGMRAFPLASFDKYLVNLDGVKNSQDRYFGATDWRYFLTEEKSGASMPLVSVNVMHEVTFGCARIVESIYKDKDQADRYTYNWRLQRERMELQKKWLSNRMNSSGWGQEGDRIEILWGPDYDDRYDYLLFKGDSYIWHFAPLPNEKETKLSMVDKRHELESYDPERGFWIHGAASRRLARRPETEPHHIMY